MPLLGTVPKGVAEVEVHRGFTIGHEKGGSSKYCFYCPQKGILLNFATSLIDIKYMIDDYIKRHNIKA